MKTVKILESFDGYPQAPKAGADRVSFVEGQEVEVSSAFADLIISKGHAEETRAKAQPKPAPAPADAAEQKEDIK